MADYSDIRAGLKGVLTGQISGLRVYEYEPDAVLEYPCIVIEQVGQHAYLPILAAGGFQADLEMTLYIYSGTNEDGWREIEKYRWPVGDKSVFAAINTDNTLQGKIQHAWVRETGPIEKGKNDQSMFWEFSCAFTLELIHAVN